MSDSPSRNKPRRSPEVSPEGKPPSLLTGLTVADFSLDLDATAIPSTVPPRPRRLWKVGGTLRTVPPFWPPMHPHCTTYVSDAPASVVAVRIAECLRRRSVAVEYDEEAITATCMTIDRCHFVVHLWRAASDFNGILVEVLHTRGSSMTFHRTTRAILNAALCFDSGTDERTPQQVSSTEYNRLAVSSKDKSQILTTTTEDAAEPSLRAQEAMENVLQLLRKDRLDAQKLGMESLVALTDTYASGSVATFAAKAVVGLDEQFYEIYSNWIIKLIQERRLPNEEDEDVIDFDAETHFEDGTSIGGGGGGAMLNKTMIGLGDEHFGGLMRSLALRVLANSLQIMSEIDDGEELETLLKKKHCRLVSRLFLHVLLDDTLGASRPPAVVAGTRLASPHEATLAIRCLRILGEHSIDAKRRLLANDDALLSHLLKARNVGKATHERLEEEAEKAHTRLSEDERSC